MLISNLWVDVGLMNNVIGTFNTNNIKMGTTSSTFSSYGKCHCPTLHDGTVPVITIHYTSLNSGVQCLCLCWAVTQTDMGCKPCTNQKD